MEGGYVKEKLYDILNPKELKEEKTAAEIIFDVFTRAGITFLE